MSSIDTIRSELLSLLTQWDAGTLNEVQVHHRAESMSEEIDLESDYDNSDPRSIPVEVLSQLEILNHQWITRDDIPAMLLFLQTPPGKEIESWHNWKKYWEAVDFEKRQAKLKGHPYYTT